MAEPSQAAAAKTDNVIDDASAPMRDRMTAYIQSLQQQIVSVLESLDQDAPFLHDSWTRPQGGFGTSCVLAKGTVLEKAGVNISVIHGTLPPPAVALMRINHQELPQPQDVGKGLPFFAAGISLVIHPRNPKAPTVHANYRYFEVTKSKAVPEGDETANTDKPGEIVSWWFGGGADLTPSYLYEEDCVHFHTTLRDACNSIFPPSADLSTLSLHPPFKRWCDEYFHIPHRGECRGIGGIFFDDLTTAYHPRLSEAANASKPSTQEEIFKFVRACGDAFVPSYVPILSRRMNEPHTDENRRWQLIRRGRYVEFNLVYDRGTKFGLQTPGARIESILMSLPETARWEYMSDMGAEGTEEGTLMEVLKNPKDWV